MATMLRPMNTSELLDRTFFLYRSHFLLFVSLVAIPNLLPLIFRLTIFSLRSSPRLAETLLTTLISGALYLFTIAAAQAATIVAVSELHLGRPVQITTAFVRAKECLVELIVIAILMGIGIVLGLICLIVPGILVAVAWSLAIPAAVIEGQGPLDATIRSWDLTRGSRLRIFLVLLMVTVLSYIVAFVFQFPLLVALVVSGQRNPGMIPTWATVYSLIASFISTSLVVPISTIASSLIYYDQRVRKEGFDIQFMISALKGSPDSPFASSNPSQS